MVMKRKWLLQGLIIIFTVSGILLIRSSIKKSIIESRKKDAQIVLNLFYENMMKNIENINYATKLSYTISQNADLQLFTEKSQEIIDKNEQIVFLAYFDGDWLKTISPQEEFKELLGKELSDLSYSYTLAKVIKDKVVEGPEELTGHQNDVFLYIHPIFVNSEYKGEIVAAIDSKYVIDQMGLNLLRDGHYDYELWRVNLLGEHKNLISVSNDSIDFSNAIKLEFNLPAKWNISILPQEGWFTPKEELLYNFISIFTCILILIFISFIQHYYDMNKNLKRAIVSDSDSGLLNYKGFCNYVDEKIRDNQKLNISLLYIQLTNFNVITKKISREEVQEYLMQINQWIHNEFSEESIGARLSDDTFVIALINNESRKQMDNIENFVLQLFLKKHIEGKRVFIIPKYSLVHYPCDGEDAKTLLEHAIACYELNKEISVKMNY